MSGRLAALLVIAGALAVPPAAGAQTFSTFGAGFLDTPSGIAVDANGLVYVADPASGSIKRFDNRGTDPAQPITAPGHMQTPVAVAVDRLATTNARIYYADTGVDRVLKIGAGGNVLVDFGPFPQPSGVEVDALGHVFATDSFDDIVVKFAADGTLLDVLGNPGGGPDSAPGHFNAPLDVEIDPVGNLYVADAGNHRVQKLDGAGNPLWQTAVAEPRGIAYDLTGKLWVSDGPSFHQLDPGNGQLIGSTTITGAVDSYGLASDCIVNLFIAEPTNKLVSRYGPDPPEEPPCFPPSNSVSPQLSGDPVPGGTLTLASGLDPSGDWTGNPTPTLAIHWQRCSSAQASSCGSVANATAVDYAVSDADRGQRLRAVIVASNDEGTAVAATDMTPEVPLVPINPPPNPPPSPPPLPAVPPLPPAAPATVVRDDVAAFAVTCPPTGAISCAVSADVVGPGSSKRAKSAAERPGMVKLARGSAEIEFDQTQTVTLALTKRAKKLVRGGYNERAVISVRVDGARVFSDRIRFNRKTAKKFGKGAK